MSDEQTKQLLMMIQENDGEIGFENMILDRLKEAAPAYISSEELFLYIERMGYSHGKDSFQNWLPQQRMVKTGIVINLWKNNNRKRSAEWQYRPEKDPETASTRLIELVMLLGEAEAVRAIEDMRVWAIIDEFTARRDLKGLEDWIKGK